MPLQTAVNPQTNETAVLVDGQWQKVSSVAVNPSDQSKAYFVGGKWLTDTGQSNLPAPRAPGNAASEAVTPLRAEATAADTALALGSAGVGSIVGGIVKAGGYANEAIAKAAGYDIGDANEAADRVTSALTYSPRTEGGKAVVSAVTKGLKAFEDWTDKQGEEAHNAIRAAGDKAADVAKSLGAPQAVVDFIDKHKEQVAAAYGSATKTGLNAASMVVGGEVAKIPGKVGEAVGVRPTAAPAADAARIRAEAYARDRLGLSWDALADATKRKLERIAANAGALEKLNPDAVKRQVHLEREGFGRKPITTTAGKLERDNATLLKEQGAAATPSGRSIVDTDVQTNRDLRANIETLVERLRGVGKSRATATTREQVGTAVAGRETGSPGALKLKERKSEANYHALYKKARETDPDATVAADPMYEFVRGNPEVLNPQIQHLGWLQTWLKKAGIEHEVPGPDGEAMPLTERRPIKLTELDDLRKKATSIMKGGGDNAHYAGEVVAAIEKMFDQVPDAAKAWREARDAFKQHKAEFENQGAIERLVGTKGGAYGTDPKTALEDVWKASVKNGKLEEIRTLKRSLLSGDADTRLAGKKALRELKAETGRDMLREITKGVSTNVKGETNITAEAINNWIKGMGGGTVEGGVEKLNVILGRRATNELMRIREDAQITKTEPTVRNVGSNTFQKILNWMDDTGLGHVVKKIPGAGPAAHLGEAALKHVENQRAVKAAGETATSVAERQAQRAELERLKQQQRSGAIPPPTYGGGQ